MNTGVHLFQLWFSQGICLAVGLLGQMVVLWYHMTIKPYGHTVELDTTEQLNNGSFIPNFLSNLHTVLNSDCILNSYTMFLPRTIQQPN